MDDEVDQPRDPKRRWRWSRRAPAKEPETASGQQTEVGQPPAAEGPAVAGEPIPLAETTAEEAPAELPRPRIRKRPKPVAPAEETDEGRREDGRKTSERPVAPAMAPIDLAPPKTYLPPPPPPEIPAAAAASAPPAATTRPAEPSPEVPAAEPSLDRRSTPDTGIRGETAEEFLSRQAAQWTPPPSAPQPAPPSAEPEEKKSGLFKRSKKPKVKVSNGFEYTVPPRDSKKGQVSVGPAPEVRREINCPRCGQPSPRGLCEACEDALSQLRQLTVAFLDE